MAGWIRMNWRDAYYLRASCSLYEHGRTERDNVKRLAEQIKLYAIYGTIKFYLLSLTLNA